VKTLHLLRHAKSDRDDPSRDDHDRPLATRGQRAAKALAEHLRDAGFAVERVYSSTSRRTRETYELVKGALGDAPVAYRDQLYLIDARGLLDFIHALPDSAASAMLIGHDPGFHTLAAALAGRVREGHGAELAQLQEKFPTGALCSIGFDVTRWRDVARGQGELIAFIRPRDLD
jgi:phosphohistidine phosphatase